MTADTWDEPKPEDTEQPRFVHRPASGPALSNLDAENHVLSCLFLDPALLPKAPDAAAFDHPQSRLTMLAMQRLAASESPILLETVAERLGPQLATVGSWPYLLGLTDVNKVPTTAHFTHFAAKITELHRLRQYDQYASAVKQAIAAGQPLPEPPAEVSTTPKQRARAPSTFALPAPDDRSILIGNRWLSRGDIGILASTSGMGKSSLSLQMAYHWALAQPIFGGFKPNGALKVLIVQAEDGDGDIAEVRHSLEHAMQLTPDQRATVDKNIVIVTDRVNRGMAFRTSLKSLIAHHHPDLVIINPLLAFMDGDVNDSKDVGSFIREQLNSLNEPASFAYLIVHHTAKPPKEKKDRQWNEVMYEMAGSADLTNAARAILSLQATETKGEFRLKAAKRGMRTGLTARVPGTINPEIMFDQPTDEVALRHSALKMTVGGQELPVIHWEVSTAKAPSQQPATARRGRPAADPESYLRFVPIGADKALPANQIFKNTNEATGMTNRGFAKMLHRAAEDGLLTLADIPGRGPCYHL